MPRSPEDQAKIDFVMQMYNEVLIPMNPDAVDRFIPPDYIQHSLLAPPGREALKEWLRKVRVESPEARQHIKHTFVDGDHVIVHTHVVRWPGDPGMAVMDIYRLANGKIAEHWDVVQEVPSDPAEAARFF